MNFKEIRLVGFKSFADKTSIKFDDGVTCIVGPNGCGKSNVADAVRWVLGEQSAKNLRGSNMTDVIFNGTETRRQLSFCEVTLVFDNTQKLFDIEYEEVAMTRRLYRSGDSEYLLNMQPCRLKDIVALLHGVGIGKEGYSIIGQGKVDQIMNAKPEDRRAIFEEATGVIKFKSQKAEIERKLESAKDNLIIFVQRMDEAEKQLRPLEKQAEAARKCREYTEQLKYEEVNSYLLRSDSFEQETARYQSKIDAADRDLAAIEKRVAEVDEEEEACRENIRLADEQLRDINQKLRLFEVGMADKSGEAKSIRAKIDGYRRQIKQIGEDVEYSLRKVKDIDAQVAESKKRKQENEKRAAEIEAACAELLKKLQEADARVALIERLSDEKRASELSSVENLAEARANEGSLTAKRDAAHGRIGEVNEAIDKASARADAYREQLAACRKDKAACQRFLDDKPRAEAEHLAVISDLTRSSQKISEEIVNCNTSIANQTNNLEMYISLKNRFNGYRDSVRRLQLEAQHNPAIGSRIKGAIADIVRTEKQYEVAIETAFGGAMQNLVTATADDARWLIEYLKRNAGGIVTFLPVDQMRARPNSGEVRRATGEEGAIGLADELVRYDDYYDNIIRYLLGNTLICDTIANATRIAKKYPRAFRIITLDGDTIATSGAMTGGSVKRDSGNLLASERQIKECEESIARKKGALVKLQAALRSCEEELEQARKDYEAFRQKVVEETANLAAIAQKEFVIEGLVESTEADIAEYRGLLERLSRQASDLESEMLSSAENRDLLNKIRADAANEAQAQETEIGRLRLQRDDLSEQLQAMRLQGTEAASVIAFEEENIARLLAEKAELYARVDNTRLEVANTERLIEQLKHEEEAVALTEEEQFTVNALRTRLETVEAEKRAHGEKQVQLAEEKRTLLASQMTKGDERSRAVREIDRATIYLETMRQKLEEQYGLDYESAQQYRDAEYDITQSESNINSLKHKIAALGLVNQRAEEDYEELLARYTDMQTQKEDLDKGIADLTGVLNDLRNEMQTKFDEGFKEINENFSKIFKELFGGGRAEMQLDYEEGTDPLDAGVEIIACPPGKKLTKISLLSGGERAFTAIAILFAILRSRPMPFCILDEIEAALDEANVDRFAKYLKKFSRDTQFIVITHRKPTMNQADTLFGVTMEEKGVSKIVSVKLSEVETRLGGDTVIA